MLSNITNEEISVTGISGEIGMRYYPFEDPDTSEYQVLVLPVIINTEITIDSRRQDKDLPGSLFWFLLQTKQGNIHIEVIADHETTQISTKQVLQWLKERNYQITT